MKILGVNSGRAVPARIDPARKRALADGSAALLADGSIACAAIEERHQRVRYAGGFRAALPAVLREAEKAPEEIDAIGLSSCCDSPWLDPEDRLNLLAEELASSFEPSRIRAAWRGRVHHVNHHDSHAALAFFGSGWRKALVCVLDGFGNRLDDVDEFRTGGSWWQGSFERQTFYVAQWSRGRILLERVEEFAAGPDEIGLAELYRSVTHYCGWPSYQYAGKTMALSAYGDRRRLDQLSLVELSPSGSIKVNVPNQHDDPIGQIEGVLHRGGYEVPSNVTRPASPPEPHLCAVASLLQHQVESALIGAVSALADRHGINSVAFGGGLALNCVALGKLARARPDLAIYVPPAPGDTGQGLGNAIWLAYAAASPVRETSAAAGISTAALGPLYDGRRIAEAVSHFLQLRAGFRAEAGLSPETLAQLAARAVMNGQTVGLYSGRAEYGPRALGQRSILADPRRADAQIAVNAIKRREPFRPFAASVLREDAGTCFQPLVPSPFMSFAGQANDQIAQTAPGIVHVDGTTRYHTVAPHSGMMRSIIEDVRRESGLSLLLNTSFNLAGEPIVETPEEALDVFERSGLDALLLEDHWLTRR